MTRDKQSRLAAEGAKIFINQLEMQSKEEVEDCFFFSRCPIPFLKNTKQLYKHSKEMQKPYTTGAVHSNSHFVKTAHKNFTREYIPKYQKN